MREPDGVTWISKTRFVTANEGDLNGGSRGFHRVEHRRQRGLGCRQPAGAPDGARRPHQRQALRRQGQRARERHLRPLRRHGLPVRRVRAFQRDLGLRHEQAGRTRLQAGAADRAGTRRRAGHPVAQPADRGQRGRCARQPGALQPEHLPVPSPHRRPTRRSSRSTAPTARRSPGPPCRAWRRPPRVPPSTPSTTASFAATASSRSTPRPSRRNSKREIRITDPDGKIAALAATLPATKDANAFDATDLAALVNADGSVNIDPEGISLASATYGGGFWIASEGTGTVGEAARPVLSANLVFKLTRHGCVVQEIIQLPAEVNAKQQRFGFEGIAGVGRQARRGVPARLGRRDAAAHRRLRPDHQDLAVHVLSAGRRGLAQTAAGSACRTSRPWAMSRFMLVERDNQGGPDARIKRLYRIDLTGQADGAVLAKTLVRDLLPDLKAPGRQCGGEDRRAGPPGQWRLDRRQRQRRRGTTAPTAARRSWSASGPWAAEQACCDGPRRRARLSPVRRSHTLNTGPHAGALLPQAKSPFHPTPAIGRKPIGARPCAGKKGSGFQAGCPVQGSCQGSVFLLLRAWRHHVQLTGLVWSTGVDAMQKSKTEGRARGWGALAARACVGMQGPQWRPCAMAAMAALRRRRGDRRAPGRRWHSRRNRSTSRFRPSRSPAPCAPLPSSRNTRCRSNEAIVAGKRTAGVSGRHAPGECAGPAARRQRRPAQRRGPRCFQAGGGCRRWRRGFRGGLGAGDRDLARAEVDGRTEGTGS